VKLVYTFEIPRALASGPGFCVEHIRTCSSQPARILKQFYWYFKKKKYRYKFS
jgi:hypothetical protein